MYCNLQINLLIFISLGMFPKFITKPFEETFCDGIVCLAVMKRHLCISAFCDISIGWCALPIIYLFSSLKSSNYHFTITDINCAEYLFNVCSDCFLPVHTIQNVKFSAGERHPKIVHSYDVWHGAKNLSKRLSKIAKTKGNAALLPWVKDIVNHFWFCCRESNTYEEFMVNTRA